MMPSLEKVPQRPAESPSKAAGASGQDLFAGLTDAQKQAVAHIDGPLLVLAGPGSGKTTVVTRRVAYLINQGIPPWQILALTFTNKAAGEMRDRIDKLVPPTEGAGRRGLTISTFHSFCARLLRRHARFANLSERFSIYDSADQRDAIKQALKEAGLDSKNWTPGSVGSAMSGAKNLLMDAAAYASRASDFHSRTIAKVYSIYERILKRNDALDFDDLLLVTARLLKDSEPVRRELQARYQYIMVDEYQDTNYAQFVIAHALAAGSPGKNICVVGDPDQSIYAWRGADIRNILEFEQHYPAARIIPLGQNFRSTDHIVQAAAALIQNNRKRKHKRLFTELGAGEKPDVVTCFDEHEEARLIVDEFSRRNADVESAVPWREMAVLYRINALSRVLEDAFRAANIPYVIARGTAFYERKEVKDALAYLRIVANPNDEVSLRRIVNVPPRGIGGVTLDKLEVAAINNQMRLFDAMADAAHPGAAAEGLSDRARSVLAKFTQMVRGWREQATGGAGATLGSSGEKAPLAELVERIIRESGLEALYRKSKAEEDLERLENLEELINAAADFVPPAAAERDRAPGEASAGSVLDSMNAFLESIALVSDADAIDPARGAVTLMTLHAAKGLEFEVVAMAGLEEGILPHSRAAMSDAELEEERRLCFVGITRAKRRLLMTRAAVRSHRGLRERTIPSQFLRELPQDHVVLSDQSGEGQDDDDMSGGVAWGHSSWDAAGRSGTRRAKRSEFDQDDFDGARPRGSFARIDLPVGCLVRHPTFGLGRVEVVTARASGSSVQVAFKSAGRKTLILEYAKLVRVED